MAKLYKGVFKRGKKFYSAIGVKGQWMHLGTFNSMEEAARAYDAAIDKYQLDREKNFPSSSSNEVPIVTHTMVSSPLSFKEILLNYIDGIVIPEIRKKLEAKIDDLEETIKELTKV